MLSSSRTLLNRSILFSTTRLRTGLWFQFSGTSNSQDSHEDFKTQTKSEATTADVFETIKDDISKNKIFIYMKGHPTSPRCGFSMTACRILDAYGSPYKSRDVLEDVELREGIKKFSNWPTIPQVYVDGEFVGGCDILMQMHENGELNEILKSK